MSEQTNDPRVSLGWGEWRDAVGKHRRVTPGKKWPIEFQQGDHWMDTDCLGPMPHSPIERKPKKCMITKCPPGVLLRVHGVEVLYRWSGPYLVTPNEGAAPATRWMFEPQQWEMFTKGKWIPVAGWEEDE